MTGIELCREIRSFDQSIPIFFCCGGAAEPDKAAAVGAGAHGYITKHFDNGELVSTLRAALKNSKK